MKCPTCGFENRDGAKFCLECGNKIESKCPSCGKNLPPTAKFCDECGHNIKDDDEIEVVNYAKPQSYTPKHLADKILTSRGSIEGERKLVTVLFADVANFTSISEKLDPEEVHQMMDGCFKILMNEIHNYEGTINQFTGDGVMALFGAPVAHEDHAQRSCQAALSIQNMMKGYSDKIENDTDLEFKIRIGINSGPVIVGAIGDDLRMDYTAIGDTTNLGSRMESNAKPGSILISEKTHSLVKDYFIFNSVGKIEVKGKKQPQNAFELLKPSGVQSRIGASIAKGLTRFVGRKKSMSILVDAFEKTKSKSGQVVGIVGEAGVGKSRLLLEMRNILPKGEVSYLEGRCLHYGSSISYLPVLDIVKVFFDIIEGDREFIVKKKINKKISQLDENLENLNPPFQDLLSLSVDDQSFMLLEPKDKRDKIFEALKDILVRTSREIPLIVAVEDLHWMDNTSGEFLDYLIGSIVNTPILLILLYRPEYTHQWGSKSYYSQIGLDQLGNESSGELVKAILEGGDVAPEIRGLILNRSAGNPLFMEEFTHTLVENGSIEKKGNQFVLTGKETEIQVPDTVQGIIASRLDRLEDNLKRTMQIASVIGRDFAFRILQTITGMREELKAYLLNLQGLEFIYEKNLFPELEYIFKHALIQEVTYNSLLLQRRKDIHERIGNAIEDIYADRLEEFYEMLAYHYSQCDNVLSAIRYLKLSGEKADKMYSHWDAVKYFEKVISQIDKLPDSTDNKKMKVEIFLAMIKNIGSVGQPEEYFWALEEAETLARELMDKKSLAKITFNIATYYSHRGQYDLSIKYSESSFKEARDVNDIDQMVPPAFTLSVAYMPSGQYRKLMDMVPDVLDLIEKNNKTKNQFSGESMNAYSVLCAYCAGSMGFLGYFNEAITVIEKGILISSELNDIPIMGSLEMSYATIHMLQGNWEASVGLFKKGIKHLDEVQYDWMSAYAQVGLGYALSMNGNKVEGKRVGIIGLERHINTGVEMWLASSHLYIGLIHIESDNMQAALQHTENSLISSETNNEQNIQGRAHITLGRILGKMESKYSNKIQKHFITGLEIFDKLEMKPDIAIGNLFLGEFYQAFEKTEKAIKHIKEAKIMFDEMHMNYWLSRAKELLKDQ